VIDLLRYGVSFLRRTLLCLTCSLVSLPAFAQTDAGIAIQGLVSIQPVNESWVGSPYLDEGIGGQAPGIAVGASMFAANGFALLGELSTTRQFELFQTGRLVSANRNNFSREGSATARLRDTLIHGLAGYTASTAADRVVVAGGISYVHTALTQDGIDVENQFGELGLDGRRRFALTGGLDYLRRLSPRASLLIGARYSWLGRAESSDQTGAGEHILRVGAGIRIRFSD
jgi:hypothetical protein